MMADDLKAKLKAWERCFLDENGRKPTTADIMSAPNDIKDSYRQYSRVRRSGKSSSSTTWGSDCLKENQSSSVSRSANDGGDGGQPKMGFLLNNVLKKRAGSGRSSAATSITFRRSSEKAIRCQRAALKRSAGDGPTDKEVSPISEATTAKVARIHSDVEKSVKKPTDLPITSRIESQKKTPRITQQERKQQEKTFEPRPFFDADAPGQARVVWREPHLVSSFDGCYDDSADSVSAFTDDLSRKTSVEDDELKENDGVQSSGLSSLENSLGWLDGTTVSAGHGSESVTDVLLSRWKQESRSVRHLKQFKLITNSFDGEADEEASADRTSSIENENEADSEPFESDEDLDDCDLFVGIGDQLPEDELSEDVYYCGDGSVVDETVNSPSSSCSILLNGDSQCCSRSFVVTNWTRESLLSDSAVGPSVGPSGSVLEMLEKDLGELGLGRKSEVVGRFVADDSEQLATKRSRAFQPSVENELRPPVSRRPTKEVDLNRNFRQINLKARRFGKFVNKGRFLRKQLFKQKLRKKFSSKSNEGGGEVPTTTTMTSKERPAKNSCFNCGQIGHWADDCPLKKNSIDDASVDVLEQIENEFLLHNCLLSQPLDRRRFTEPLLSDTDSDVEEDLPEEFLERICKAFKLKSLRDFQLAAINSVLRQRSALVVQPTASGKSLCYQACALLYGQSRPGHIALYISPLLSLMDDQLKGIPRALKAAALHSGMTESLRETVRRNVEAGQVHLLLISPECLTNAQGSLLRRLPPVSFVCLDEAHCLSQWSHTFRPSYLHVMDVLRSELNVRCFLGLTATASTACLEQLRSLMPPCSQSGSALGSNLRLSVSRDANRDTALVWLLKDLLGSRQVPVIVYGARRDTVDRLARLIRTSLLASDYRELLEKSGKTTKKSRPTLCESYHAGLDAKERRRLQTAFMSDRVIILCATIAFGMGINKRNVRAVVHFDQPSSFESFVQEAGRAGRDSQPAKCHVFLSALAADANEAKRHIFADWLGRTTLQRFVRMLFAADRGGSGEDVLVLAGDMKCAKCSSRGEVKCSGHWRSISASTLGNRLDIRETMVDSLLSYCENMVLLSGEEEVAGLPATVKVEKAGTDYAVCLADELPVASAVGRPLFAVVPGRNPAQISVTSYKGAAFMRRLMDHCMALKMGVSGGQEIVDAQVHVNICDVLDEWQRSANCESGLSAFSLYQVVHRDLNTLQWMQSRAQYD